MSKYKIRHIHNVDINEIDVINSNLTELNNKKYNYIRKNFYIFSQYFTSLSILKIINVYLINYLHNEIFIGLLLNIIFMILFNIANLNNSYTAEYTIFCPIYIIIGVSLFIIRSSIDTYKLGTLFFNINEFILFFTLLSSMPLIRAILHFNNFFKNKKYTYLVGLLSYLLIFYL